MARRLTAEEVQTFAGREGVSRCLVEQYLLCLNLTLDWIKSEKNLVKDATSWGWDPKTTQAIREGIALSYQNIKDFKPVALVSGRDRSLQAVITEVEAVLRGCGRIHAAQEFVGKAWECSDYSSLMLLCVKYVELV